MTNFSGIIYINRLKLPGCAESDIELTERHSVHTATTNAAATSATTITTEPKVMKMNFQGMLN